MLLCNAAFLQVIRRLLRVPGEIRGEGIAGQRVQVWGGPLNGILFIRLADQHLKCWNAHTGQRRDSPHVA